MENWTPQTVKKLRTKLGWSVVDMASFFGCTRATIYYWEKGKSRPDETIRALLNTLAQECSRQRAYYSREEFRAWSRRVKENGLRGFLQMLSTQPGCAQEAHETLAEKARGQGHVVLKTREGTPLACIVPLTESGLMSFTRALVAADVEDQQHDLLSYAS